MTKNPCYVLSVQITLTQKSLFGHIKLNNLTNLSLVNVLFLDRRVILH